MKYEIEKLEAETDIPSYLKEYVDIPTFLECCKACPNYGKIWSCPPYDFDVEAYWKRFGRLKIFGTRLIFQKEDTERTYTKEELDVILKETLEIEKRRLSGEMERREREIPGSEALSAGSCICCESCTRPEGKACRCPEKMRYSIESLGGNVGKTASRLLGAEIEWMEENRLPRCFTLINGLLIP